MKKTAEYIGITVALLIMGAAVFTYVAPHWGWQVNAVLSGSMEPALRVGSIVVSSPVRPEEIQVGDIITFNTSAVDSGTVTHRVNAIVRQSPYVFETKGDANESADVFTVPGRSLVGRVVFQMPFLGYLTQFMKTATGFFATVVVPGILLLGFYVWSIINEVGRMRRKKRREVAES